MKQRIEVFGQCGACNGTGIYVGMAERGGVGVHCHSCNGSGMAKYVLEWTPFKCRRERDDVTTVVECNPGICISPEIPIGGVSFEEWQKLSVVGQPFPPKSQMREYTCPLWWCQCSRRDGSKRPEWDECDILWCMPFSSCPHFDDKAACWERWDKENGDEE